MSNKFKIAITSIWVLSVSLLIFLGFPARSLADNTGANFTISPIYPSNQLKNHLGYFALKVTPAQKGQLTVLIQNMSTTKTKTLRIGPTVATTTDQGQVNYSPSEGPRDPSAVHTLPEIMSKSVTVKLQPKQGENVTFQYQIPKSGFKGEILGGIYAIDTATHKATAKSQQFGINDRFAMALGVDLNENPDVKVAPNLRIRYVVPTLVRNNPTINVNLQNDQPVLFGKLNIQGRITRKGNTATLLHYDVKDYAMAPNSNFNYGFNTGKSQLNPGNYTAYIKAEAGDYHWNLKRNFTITGNQVQSIAHRMVVPRSNLPWIIILITLLIIFIAVTFYALGKRNRRSHQQ